MHSHSHADAIGNSSSERRKNLVGMRKIQGEIAKGLFSFKLSWISRNFALLQQRYPHPQSQVLWHEFLAVYVADILADISLFPNITPSNLHVSIQASTRLSARASAPRDEALHPPLAHSRRGPSYSTSHSHPYLDIHITRTWENVRGIGCAIPSSSRAT